MRYSLLSRFQGGIWGSLLGETIINKQVSVATKIAMAIQEKLIYSGKLTRVDWQEIAARYPMASENSSSAQTAIITLPLALFYHECPSVLEQKLAKAAQMWLEPKEKLEDVLLWGDGISLALREKLQPEQLIPSLLIKQENKTSSLSKQLQEIGTYLSQGTSLKKVLSQLSGKSSLSTALALAIYCFAFTPEDFSLSLTRAMNIENSSAATGVTALTGALSGVYNSWQGIPLSWRLARAEDESFQLSYQKGKDLWGSWSGFANVTKVNLDSLPVVATPLIIQPRASLSIISQKYG